jgi:hypothetical protein
VTADVDAELEQKIAELVAARREVLAEAVRDAVNAELVALVDRELDAALERLAGRNGSTPAAERPGQSVPAPGHIDRPAEPCSSCGERPRAAGRTECSRCRSRRERARRRERRAPPADDVDGPRQADEATGPDHPLWGHVAAEDAPRAARPT